LPVTFWAEAVNTACYVQNRVFVNKSQNTTPYELFNGKAPTIGFLKPFGCHVMILNTLDNLGKFKAKGDEGYFIGYSMYKRCSKSKVRKNESSWRYILLPNWAHDVLLESTSSKPYEESSSQVPEGSGNHNSTASTFNPSAEQMVTLTVESPIPTASLPVPTAR
nr:retrovirus-related Pol polyprotein from transposon TNT 1-94 [Tanacetum cinerariifolium]